MNLNQVFGVNPIFDGVEVSIAKDCKVICPALSLGQLKGNQLHIKAIRESNNDSAVDVMNEHGIPVLMAALKRNYPAVTEELLAEYVDANTFKLFLAAALGTGEAKAVQE